MAEKDIVKENTPDELGTEPIGKLLLKYAVPAIIAMTASSLYNIIDSIFIGQWSNDALTAVGLAFPMQNLIIAMSTGLGVGINAVLSKSLGEQNSIKASQTAFNGCYIMLVISLIFVIIGLTCLPS